MKRVSQQSIYNRLLESGRVELPDGAVVTVPKGTPAMRVRLVAARAIAEYRARALARALEAPSRRRDGDWQSVRMIAELVARHWSGESVTTPYFRLIVGDDSVVVEKASGSTPLATIRRQARK